MMIGVVVAALGSIGAYALVRDRDFVPSYSPSDAAPEQPAGGGSVSVIDATSPVDTAPASAPTPRPPGRPRDERATQAITDAALHQLKAMGYARVSMESIASEAGVARATVYRRFKDKADLITTAIADNPGGRFSGGAFGRPSSRPHRRTSRPSTSASARVASRSSAHCSARARNRRR